MSDTELAEIEQRANAATPGPWVAFLAEDDPLGRSQAIVSHKTNQSGARLGRFVTWMNDDGGNADATFIAACRTDVPRLIARIRELNTMRLSSPVPTREAMRHLTGYKVNGCNEELEVEALDDPGSGGACHLYRITGFDSSTNKSSPLVPTDSDPATCSHVLFQNGPIPDVGTNGVTHEGLLAILIDRLEGFQKGQFANQYNAEALNLLKAAQGVLQQRTKDRLARGVEGTHTV